MDPPNDTDNQNIDSGWLQTCVSGEILQLGEEAVVFFGLARDGRVLIQHNAWSVGSHELEWIDAIRLSSSHRRPAEKKSTD